MPATLTTDPTTGETIIEIWFWEVVEKPEPLGHIVRDAFEKARQQRAHPQPKQPKRSKSR